MVSAARETYTQAYYHVYVRGARRLNIFQSEQDCKKLLYIFKDAFEKYDFVIHAFCLMSNHYHFLIETFGSKDELSKILRYVNSRFAIYLNQQVNLSGHVFEDRFQSKVVYDKAGLLRLMRYIERNPVKAGIIERCEEWNWSSSSIKFREAFNFDFISKSLIERFFNLETEPMQAYIDFINFKSVDGDIFDPINSSDYVIYLLEKFLKNKTFDKESNLLKIKAYLMREFTLMNFKEISEYLGGEISDQNLRKQWSRINSGMVNYSPEFRSLRSEFGICMASQMPQGKV